MAMKLDRNTNRGGHGKYALVNMRKLIPFLDAAERANSPSNSEQGLPSPDKLNSIVSAFNLLVELGIITLGNETPGEQFFVMKYKDKFTAAGLQGYADAIKSVLRYGGDPKPPEGLSEYWFEMQREADTARKLGNRIPD